MSLSCFGSTGLACDLAHNQSRSKDLHYDVNSSDFREVESDAYLTVTVAA